MQEPGVSSLVSVRMRNRHGGALNGGIDETPPATELSVPVAASESVLDGEVAADPIVPLEAVA
jgi:hypothetical protein